MREVVVLIRRQNYYCVLGPVSWMPPRHLWMPDTLKHVCPKEPAHVWGEGADRGAVQNLRLEHLWACAQKVRASLPGHSWRCFPLENQKQKYGLGACVLLCDTCPDGAKPSFHFRYVAIPISVSMSKVCLGSCLCSTVRIHYTESLPGHTDEELCLMHYDGHCCFSFFVTAATPLQFQGSCDLIP